MSAAYGDLPVTVLIADDPLLAMVCALIIAWLGVTGGLIAWVFSDPPRPEPAEPRVPSSDEHLLDVAETVEVVRRG